MLSDDDFSAWFRLLETPGVGRETARQLLAACGSPAQVFEADPEPLRQWVGPAVAAALGQLPPLFKARLHAAVGWRRGGPQRHVLTLGDSAYPSALLQSADPPLLLYVHGDLALLSARSLAIVGSRGATAQGLDNARAFAAELCRQGWNVVSGLAQGIDGAAHEGALSVAGAAGAASTIAVVGTGLDIVYPPRHRGLAQRIAEVGAVVSEFAPGTPALPTNFPQRNRIIAGLSLGTLVVEAALKSGSLITARLASEAGREVFALPGSIHAPQAKGCHALIKQGAKLVESVEDILEELRSPPLPGLVPARPLLPTGQSEPAEHHMPLVHALGHDPMTLDALQARTGWPAQDLMAALMELELSDHVARLPGGLYQRRSLG